MNQNNSNVFLPSLATLFVTFIHFYIYYTRLKCSEPMPCFSFLILVFSSLLSLVLLIVVTIKLTKDKCSLNACLWLLALFLNIFLPYPFSQIHQKLKSNMLNEVVEANKPLIKAIERYHSHNGEYPNSLDNLIPEFIKAIPEGELFKKEDYEYRKTDDGEFEICITFNGKYLNQDKLIYWSKKKDKPKDPDENWYGNWFDLPFDCMQ